MRPGKKAALFQVTLTASALTQILAALSCFLGAFVLPWTFPVFQGLSTVVLVLLGCLMLAMGLANLLLGRHVTRLMARVGKRSGVVIPREGVGYLAIMLALAVGAMLGQKNTPLLVFGMMAGPFILNGWVVYSMLKKVSVSRTIPSRAAAGQAVNVQVSVRNDKLLLASHLLEVKDQINSSDADEAEARVTFVRVPPRAERVSRYQIRFSRRGRYTFGPARVSSRFPMGIGERGQLLSETNELIVHPSTGRLLPAWKQQQRELAEASRTSRTQAGVFDDEFHRIREYRDDDNPRSIHWRSTARRGILMTREYHQNRRSDSFVLLHLPDDSGWLEEDSEAAISVAATMCVDQTRAAGGNMFLLGIAGRETELISSRIPGAFREAALDGLATCQRSSNADLGTFLERVLSELDLSDDRIILITPEPESARRVLHDLAGAHPRDYADLQSKFDILEAHRSALSRVCTLPDDQRLPELQEVVA